MRYSNYKATDINWIGEIPEQWNVIRVKGNCYVKGRIGWQELKADEFVDEGIHCVTGTDFQNQFVNWDTCYRVSLERYLVDDNIQLKEGDVLITKDGTIGKTAIVKNLPEKATLNSGIFLIRPEKKKLTNEFLYWILNSTVFEEYNNFTKTGATILHLYQNVFVEMSFPLPTTAEQLAIANYLDDQTQKIDRLIANKKAQAEKLKELRQIEINNAVTKGLNLNAEMKESGIEWLGKIPKHWEVKRLKNILLNINSGDGISNDELVEDGEIEVYGGNGVMGYTDKYNSDGKVIIIGRVGAKCGVVYLVDKKIWISDNALQSRTYQNYEFVYYLIDAMNLNNYANQNAQPLITGGILKGLYAALPPKNEQAEIANFLQKRTTAIDQLIKNIEAQIEKLQELRKIKIYEAVTGKIKVNAYAETTA